MTNMENTKLKKKNLSKPKAKDINFETKVRAYLERNGWLVIRNAVKDTSYLVTIREFTGDVKFIMSSIDKNLQPHEKDLMFELKDVYKAKIYKCYPRYTPYSSKLDNYIVEEIN